MIPFERTWPYESVGNDLYVITCPFCEARNVLLPIKKDELASVREGRKRLVVFPCCHHSIRLIDNDPDYLLADRALR